MHDTDTDGLPEFRTGTATRIGDSILAVGPAAMLLVGLPMFALAAGGFVVMATGPVWLGILVGLSMLTFFGRLLALGVCEQLRFRVTLFPEFVRLGKGIFRLDLPYEMIDEVVVMNDRENGVGVGFVSCGRTASVRLKFDDAIRCFESLQSRCHNAVFIDANGHELVSVDHECPEHTAWIIERYSRRSGVRWILGAVSCTGAAIWRLAEIVQVLRGKHPEVATLTPKMVIVDVILIVAAIGCVVSARAAFSRAERAKVERLAMLAESEQNAA